MSDIRETEGIEVPDVQKTYREPAEAEPRRQGGGGLFLALILIGLGAVLLLNNLGLFTIDVATLVRFWPVLLILIGLNVLVGRRSGIGSMVIAVLGLALIGGALLLSGNPGAVRNTPGFIAGGAYNTVEGSFSAPIEDVDALDVEITLDWMALDVSAGADDSIDADYVAYDVTEPEFVYVPRSGQGDLTITQSASNIRVDQDTQRLNLTLPPNVPLNVTINNDLGEVVLDLNELDVEALNVETSAGRVVVILPNDGSIDFITVDTDLGSVEVRAVDGSDLVIGSIDLSTGSGAIDLTLPAAGSLGDVTLSSDLGSVTMESAGDPRDLAIDSLEISTGSGAIDATLPGQGEYDASLTTDLGSVEVVIPEGLEARADLDTDLGGMEVRNATLEDQGSSIWQTENYGRSDDAVTLSISTDLGSITIR